MRKLITLAALCAAFISPAEAATAYSDIYPVTVEDSVFKTVFNVRYVSELVFEGGDTEVYVVWYDANDWQKASEFICENSRHVTKVIGGSLKSYLQAHRDVVEAGLRDRVSTYKCER